MLRGAPGGCRLGIWIQVSLSVPMVWCPGVAADVPVEYASMAC